MKPFADFCRPETINDMVGQQHLIGKGKIITNLLENNAVSNMILYGPPGTGKTTLANIIAKTTGREYIKLNATNCGVKDLKDAIERAKTNVGLILYVDEFHMLNKKQQQSLLEVLESGLIILIASTTENPYFSVYKAILSRCNVFEFKPLTIQDIKNRLNTIIPKLNNSLLKKFQVENGVVETLANLSNGDIRSAINLLELLYYKKISETDIIISVQDIESLELSKFRMDKDGDEHFNCLSAFHKSIRGSDAQAAIHYLARLIKAGDIQGICRRLLCAASEDIGLANPNAITVVKACVDSALQVGFPEARLHLAQATIFLALQPKSNSAYLAINSALDDLDHIDCGSVPEHLKNIHVSKTDEYYKYPHDYPNHWVEQEYLPPNIKNKKYYVPQENKIEQAYSKYWDIQN